LKPSPALHAAAAVAAEFVPGKLNLGSAALAPGGAVGQWGAKQGEQEAAKKPLENGVVPAAASVPEAEAPKALEAKRPAAVTLTEPTNTPAEPAEPEPFTGRIAGRVKVEGLNKRYSLRVMKLLRHDQKYIDMEPTDALKSKIEDFRKLLLQTPELDPGQDMPDRKQAEARKAGVPGTPKSGRGKKNAEPLRDKNGRIVEVDCCGSCCCRVPRAACRQMVERLGLESCDGNLYDLGRVGWAHSSGDSWCRATPVRKDAAWYACGCKRERRPRCG